MPSPWAPPNITTFVRRAIRFAPLGAALLVGACSGNSQPSDGPNWSLADKPPVSLGGTGATANTAPRDVPVYDYRGGRDPVTGRTATLGSPPFTAAPAPAGEGGVARVVQVQKGDTLHGLSLTYHVSVKALMEANNLTKTTIVAGKKLIIPSS